MNATTATLRGKTGERCEVSGVYEFEKYVDGTVSPQPTVGEREIALSIHNVFPAIRSSGKACWWRLVRRT